MGLNQSMEERESASKADVFDHGIVFHPMYGGIPKGNRKLPLKQQIQNKRL